MEIKPFTAYLVLCRLTTIEYSCFYSSRLETNLLISVLDSKRQMSDVK